MDAIHLSGKICIGQNQENPQVALSGMRGVSWSLLRCRYVGGGRGTLFNSWVIGPSKEVWGVRKGSIVPGGSPKVPGMSKGNDPESVGRNPPSDSSHRKVSYPGAYLVWGQSQGSEV